MRREFRKLQLTVAILTLFFISNAFVFAFAMEGPNYTSNMTDEELARENQKSYLGEHPICLKYFYNVLYVGMPEENFVNRFTKNASYEGTARPYIFKKAGTIYYITFPNLPYLRDISLVSRITFLDGKLIKSESRHMGEPPFMWYSYSDDTDYLRGNYTFNATNSFKELSLPENNPARLSSMSEQEFLSQIKTDNYFHLVKEQSAKSGNRYIIQGKNGKKWRLSFYPEGGLFRQEPMQ